MSEENKKPKEEPTNNEELQEEQKPEPQPKKAVITDEELAQLAQEVTSASSEKERQIAEKAVKDFQEKLKAKEAFNNHKEELEQLKQQASKVDELEKKLEELTNSSSGRRTYVPTNDPVNQVQRESGQLKLPKQATEAAVRKFLKMDS